MPVRAGRLDLSRRGILAATLGMAATSAIADPGTEADARPETANRSGKPHPPAGRAPPRATAERTRSILQPTPTLPLPARIGSTSVNGTTLFFAEFGAGAPVLFLHGGLGNANYWGLQVAALADTHRVVVMDTRGHGRSPVMSAAFSFSTFAQDVEGLLDHLGLHSVAVVGWSDGGITGLRLAMTRPQRVDRLFCFGANATPDGLIPHGSRQPTFAAYLARCKGEYATLSPAPDRWNILTAGLGAMWRSEPNFSRADLSRIGVPTVIAVPRHDEIIRARHPAYIAGAIPGARLVDLKAGSHFAMLQEPRAFNDALRAFLTG